LELEAEDALVEHAATHGGGGGGGGTRALSGTVPKQRQGR
jgi:hypothetical protein